MSGTNSIQNCAKEVVPRDRCISILNAVEALNIHEDNARQLSLSLRTQVSPKMAPLKIVLPILSP